MDNNLKLASRKNANRKMHDLTQNVTVYDLTKKQSLLNAFVSQFSYLALTSFKKDVFVGFRMTKNQHFKNCLTRINLF